MYLPAKFQDEMKHLLGEEYPAYEASFQEDRVCGLRVNQAKISVEDFRKLTPFHLTPVPWTENGFYYDPSEPVTKHPHYHAGLYYIQEPSAMVPASRLPVEKGERVLDLCAAPGGKSTELGARLCGTGILVSNDISRSRAVGLLKNLELFGIGNLLVTSEPPETLLKYFRGYFHKILVDAPCSGEGMFRRDPSMIRSWEERGPESYVPIQRQILREAAKLLMPGGELLYSTCTFDQRENEENLAWLMEECPDLQLVPAAFGPGFSEGLLPGTIRIWPHKVKGEGHFAALLKKEGTDSPGISEETGARKKEPEKKSAKIPVLPAEMQEFFNMVSGSVLDGKAIEIRGGKAYALPEGLPGLKGLSFLRTGLYLGELKKSRFEPSQALAMYLRKEEFAHTVDLPSDDGRVLRYLKGETLECPESHWKGWTLICTDGFPLGWAKGDRGTFKNKYCTGWRLQ
ncbi:MAG: RsmB/NOP family class I SAM-dependent RNA methyltransferase [Candidatus Limivivens sp.]|nr:RsmB/NOP family class I SAM-dependent RNA methyltransferase [Candidatus Limivivens sp.]